MLRNSVHDRESSLVARKNGRQCLHAGLGPAQAQVANDSIPTLGSLKSRAGNAMAETQEESRLPASTPPHTRKNLPWAVDDGYRRWALCFRAGSRLAVASRQSRREGAARQRCESPRTLVVPFRPEEPPGDPRLQ